jgi:DNA invertase Pin-like site-specific DNA recombinase
MSTTTNGIDLAGTGAAYIRISDDRQDTTRQYDSIHAFEKRHGVTIAQHLWFCDPGYARDTADSRPKFQQLIRLAEDGKVRWIVIDALDRFGTKSTRQQGHYLYRLAEAGCKLYDIAGREWTSEDDATELSAWVAGKQSVREQKDKSHRALSVKPARARAGRWQGGVPGPGFDLGCFLRGSKEELWRCVWDGFQKRRKVYPDGRPEEPFNGRKCSPKFEEGQELRLIPTRDRHTLEAVRSVFERYATESLECTDLAHFLNDRNIRNANGGLIRDHHILRMLQDPSYIGHPCYNRRSMAKFHQLRKGQAPVPVSNLARKETRHAKEDWIQSDERLYDPLVDEATWDAVQRKLAQRKARPKAPRKPEEFLQGLVYCAGCGREMYVRQLKSPKSGKCRDGFRGTRYQFYCSSYQSHWRNLRDDTPPCGRNPVLQDVIEPYLTRWLEESSTRLDLMTRDDGAGRQNAETESHRAAFAEGVKRLEAYLAEHHPVEYAAIIDEMDREARDQEQWQKDAGGDGPSSSPGPFLAGVPDLVAIHERHRHDRLKVEIGGTLVQRCLNVYRARVDEKAVRAELQKLRAEQARRVDEWRDLPDVKSVRDEVAAQMIKLDRRITALERQGSGLVELLETHWRELCDLQRRLHVAAEELAGERDHRRLAECLRSCIRRISLRFRAVAKGPPGKAHSELDSVTIEPVEGEAVTYPAENAHYGTPAVVRAGSRHSSGPCRSAPARPLPSTKPGPRP